MSTHTQNLLSPETRMLRDSVADVVRFLHGQGWTPATSSNFSCRGDINTRHFSISVSGLDKGDFSGQDFLEVDFDGRVIDPDQAHLRPSAETLLHALVYRLYPQARVVLHTHSVNGVVLGKLAEKQGGVTFREFEILKGLEGIKTHEVAVRYPVFPNAQDIGKLCAEIEPVLQGIDPLYGFGLAGHGLYTWGETPAQAKRHAEVFEYLFEAVLKLRSHGYPDYS